MPKLPKPPVIPRPVRKLISALVAQMKGKSNVEISVVLHEVSERLGWLYSEKIEEGRKEERVKAALKAAKARKRTERPEVMR